MSTSTFATRTTTCTRHGSHTLWHDPATASSGACAEQCRALQCAQLTRAALWWLLLLLQGSGVATGIEMHAAAGVLQRSFRVQRSRSEIRTKKAVAIRMPGDTSEQVAPAQPTAQSTRAAGGGVHGVPLISASRMGRAAPPTGEPASVARRVSRDLGLGIAGAPAARKPALQPSRVAALKPAHPAQPKQRAPSPPPSSRRQPKPPPQKPALKPTRVKDGFG
jgi:hypothetical protein